MTSYSRWASSVKMRDVPAENCRGGLQYNGSCFEGQAAIDTCNVDLCRHTSMGPLCGECKMEPRSYMKDQRCYQCKGGQTTLVMSVIFFLAIAPTTVVFVLYRFSRLRALALRSYRRIFDIGRFKVVSRTTAQNGAPDECKRLTLHTSRGLSNLDLTVTFARVCSQVWVTYQIMTTVAWNVQVVWPEVSDACARLVVYD